MKHVHVCALSVEIGVNRTPIGTKLVLIVV